MPGEMHSMSISLLLDDSLHRGSQTSAVPRENFFKIVNNTEESL